MRTMKEPNYSSLRQLLNDYCGSPVLDMFKNYQEQIGLEPNIFDLVYQGFWDIYTFKATLPEVSAKKMLTWIQKVKLICDEAPV